METFNEFTADLSIKKVEFRTGMKSDVFLLVHFNENKELNKNNINAVIFKDLSFRMFVGKGGRVRMEFDDNMVPKIKRVLRIPKKVEALPENCNSCGTKLEGNEQDLRCPNPCCSATSRGFLFKLLKYANPNASDELLRTYLDNYAYNDTSNQIDNPYEFKIVFNSIKDHNTDGRLAHWEKFHEEKGAELHKMDVALQGWFSNESFSAESFWDICNFPNLEEKDFKVLSQISPNTLFKKDWKKKVFNKSKRCGKLLETNLDFIMFLRGWFLEYGDKEWETSRT